MDYLWLIVSILLVSAMAYLAWADRQSSRRAWEVRERRPALLRQARLVMSEEFIRCERPARLIGRVDQVYELPNGELCIVDTKHRRPRRVYESDIVQLSTYATILRSHGHRVHPQGYVRQAWNGKVNYLPAKLLEDEKVLALLDYRKRVLAHPDHAPLAVHPRLCDGCGQREVGRCAGRTNQGRR
ncbi:hypothetical protein D6833_12665 [Candidatus Parcubacteria bacterium]|nr:MAG: hypothetical protein D6833_12665 [Candidatus Parcubacteria bacterium]